MKSKVSVGLVNLVAGIFVLSCPCYVYSADPNFDISLGNVTNLNGEEPIDVVIPSFENDVTVTIKDLPTKTAFVVFQVHSFPHKVTVKPMAPEVTDLGIDYSFIVHPNAKNLVFLISSPPTLSTAAMAVATAYGAEYAVPGDCAMESVMRNSPSLAIEATNSTVKLFAQKSALSIKDTTCQGGGLSYEFYFKFAYNVETSDDYFEQIKTMLTYQRITAKATKASYMGGPPTQRIFARYSGIRVFYGLAVKNLEVTTMYPALGYLMEDDAAWGPKIVIVAMFFMGVTLLSYGHSHFPLHLFFSGLVAGHHVCYAGCVLGGVQEEDILGWALFGGLVIGGAVLLIWITWAMPGVCIIVPIISAAYLFACTIFYLTSGNVAMFGGPSYWGVFTAVLVLITSLFFIDPVNGTWAAFATIGGYLIIRFLNYLFGGQLHHIVENPMRRLTEDGFDEVITTPPLQTDDVLLFCCWMLLITLGFLRHKRHARGRAPFPPPPRLFPTAPTSDERRPLLPNEAITIPE